MVDYNTPAPSSLAACDKGKVKKVLADMLQYHSESIYTLAVLVEKLLPGGNRTTEPAGGCPLRTCRSRTDDLAGKEQQDASQTPPLAQGPRPTRTGDKPSPSQELAAMAAEAANSPEVMELMDKIDEALTNVLGELDVNSLAYDESEFLFPN